MKKLLKTTLCAASLALCAAAQGAIPDSAEHIFTFDSSDLTDSGASSSISWQGGNTSLAYGDGVNGTKALQTSTGESNPYGSGLAMGRYKDGSNNITNGFSVVCCIKPSRTNGEILWSIGNTEGAMAIMTANSTIRLNYGWGKEVVQDKNVVASKALSEISDDFHTFAVVMEDLNGATTYKQDLTTKFYIDGVLVGSGSKGFYPDGGYFRLGGWYGTSDNTWYTGQSSGILIDDWRVFDRALTAEEASAYADSFAREYPTLIWNGTDSSATWDTSSSNWKNGDDAATYGSSNYNIQFTDAAECKTVSVDSAVTPLSVTVDNSSGNDYTFTGSTITPQNGIVTKQGAGTLSIPNNMVGGTINIEGGKVNMSYSASTSSTKVTFAGDSELSVSGNSYVLQADVTIDSGVTATITPANNNTTYYIGTSHNVVNNGTIAITGGSGTIAFTGTYSGSGNVTVSGGNLFLTDMTGLNLEQATDSGSIYIGSSSSATLTNPDCDIAKISLWGDGSGSTLNVSGGTFKTSNLALGTTTKVTAENVEMEIGSLSGAGSLNAELKTGGSFKFTGAIDMSSKVTAIDAAAISSSEKTIVLLTAPSASTFDTSKVSISSDMTTAGYSIKLVSNDDGTKSIVATKANGFVIIIAGTPIEVPTTWGGVSGMEEETAAAALVAENTYGVKGYEAYLLGYDDIESANRVMGAAVSRGNVALSFAGAGTPPTDTYKAQYRENMTDGDWADYPADSEDEHYVAISTDGTVSMAFANAYAYTRLVAEYE